MKTVKFIKERKKYKFKFGHFTCLFVINEMQITRNNIYKLGIPIMWYIKMLHFAHFLCLSIIFCIN